MSFLISKPFKGYTYYEMQVGPFVLQYLHRLEHRPNMRGFFRLGRFQIWWDTAWKTHMLSLPRPIRRFIRKYRRSQ